MIAKFKAKLVAQSFSQILSIDFAKIFVPIIRKKFLQIYLVFYLIFNLFIHQVDIVEVYMKNFFGNNKFPIFIKLILKIEYLWQIRNGFLYKLLKCFNSLKRSKRLWNQNVIAFFKNLSFTQLNRDSSILIQRFKEKTSIINMYIDNFLLASNIIAILNILKKSLAKKYNTKNLKKVKTIIRW